MGIPKFNFVLISRDSNIPIYSRDFEIPICPRVSKNII
jgi:hypothetical protein